MEAELLAWPESLLQDQRGIKKAQEHLSQTLQRDPTASELAEELGFELKKIEDLISFKDQSVFSLNQPSLNNPAAGNLDNVILDRNKLSIEEIGSNQLLKEDIETLLDQLSAREKQVIEMFFGLNGYQNHSLNDISKQLKVSHSTVSNIRNKALKVLLFHASQKILTGLSIKLVSYLFLFAGLLIINLQTPVLKLIFEKIPLKNKGQFSYCLTRIFLSDLKTEKNRYH